MSDMVSPKDPSEPHADGEEQRSDTYMSSIPLPEGFSIIRTGAIDVHVAGAQASPNIVVKIVHAFAGMMKKAFLPESPLIFPEPCDEYWGFPDGTIPVKKVGENKYEVLSCMEKKHR